MKQILWLKTLIWGFIAGALAGLAMLLTMALLRLFLGWPTPTELIFDRIFPQLTVEFFIGSLVRAGGYTPLKLQGVLGALAGQVIVAGLAASSMRSICGDATGATVGELSVVRCSMRAAGR